MFTFIENEFAIADIEDVKALHIKAYIKFQQRNKRKVSYIKGEDKKLNILLFFVLLKMGGIFPYEK